jgi:tRNA-specific 2-thiouridylase
MAGPKPKVLLAMSGGVDSSVAAALLLREGCDVVGVFMRLGSPGESFDELIQNAPQAAPERSAGAGCDPRQARKPKIGHQGCCSINDAADARMVAAKLGIPFYVVNFKKDFGRIIDYFVGEYNAGRTPNPCIRCNDWLKFGKLHDYARQIDADYVASGHYARIERDPKPPHGNAVAFDAAFPRLLRGVDHDKDQSYVLFGMPRLRLAEMLLPIGGYRKGEVRRLAAEFDLPVFDKPDSQEICFVPDNDYAGLVQRTTPERVQPGDIIDQSGRVLGRHEGHQHFTIGQRRGVGLALGHPVYVVDKNVATNTIVVGPQEDLLAGSCTARECNWLIDPPAGGRWLLCTAQIRYNAEPVPAAVRRCSDAELEVRFDEPQSAVAPGQAVVCYDGEAVICGGWIEHVRQGA